MKAIDYEGIDEAAVLVDEAITISEALEAADPEYDLDGDAWFSYMHTTIMNLLPADMWPDIARS